MTRNARINLMKIINKLFHIAWPSLCLNHLYWKKDVLVCRKCGEVAATRYIYDGQIRVLVFDTYECIRDKIMQRKDSGNISSQMDVIGEVSYVDWDTFRREELHKIRSIDIQMPVMNFKEEEEDVELLD